MEQRLASNFMIPTYNRYEPLENLELQLQQEKDLDETHKNWNPEGGGIKGISVNRWGSSRKRTK